MSLAFWLTALAVVIWLTLSALKIYVSNTTDENRVQLLQSLGPAALNLENPIFLGFFHPYW